MRRRSYTFAMINRGCLELATSPVSPHEQNTPSLCNFKCTLNNKFGLLTYDMYDHMILEQKLHTSSLLKTLFSTFAAVTDVFSSFALGLQITEYGKFNNTQ